MTLTLPGWYNNCGKFKGPSSSVFSRLKIIYIREKLRSKNYFPFSINPEMKCDKSHTK